MNTREIYFKTLTESEIPFAYLGYVYKDSNEVIQIGNFLRIELRYYEPIISESIAKMKEKEQMIGFMFWCNTDEFKEFWNSIIFN